MSSKNQIPIILVVFLMAIALVNAFASAYYWYWVMRWFDMPMHFAGGAWLALFGAWWQYGRLGIVPHKFIQFLGTCLVFVISIGLLWEVYEATVSFFTVGHMNDIVDTVGDVVFDILGGVTVSTIVWFSGKFKK